MNFLEYHYFNGGPAGKRPWPRKRKLAAGAGAAALILALGLWFFLARWVPGSRLAGYFPREESRAVRAEVRDVATHDVLASKDLAPEETARFRACLEDTTLWRQGPGTFRVYEDATYVVTCLDQQGATLYRGEFWGGRRMSLSCAFQEPEGEPVTASLWALVPTPLEEYWEALFPHPFSR